MVLLLLLLLATVSLCFAAAVVFLRYCSVLFCFFLSFFPCCGKWNETLSSIPRYQKHRLNVASFVIRVTQMCYCVEGGICRFHLGRFLFCWSVFKPISRLSVSFICYFLRSNTIFSLSFFLFRNFYWFLQIITQYAYRRDKHFNQQCEWFTTKPVSL